MKNLLSIVFTFMLLQVACVKSGDINSSDVATFLFKFTTDSAFSISQTLTDLKCYEFEKPTDTKGKVVNLPDSSLKNIINLIGKDVTSEEYMISINQNGDKFVYSIVSKKMDCAINYHFKNKGLWQLFMIEYYNYPPNLSQSCILEAPIIKFMMSFYNDSIYRNCHINDTVYGRDYTLYNTNNESNSTSIPLNAKWNKDNLINSLDFFIKDNRDSLVHYLLMEYPDSASYVILNSKNEWGAAMIFKMINNEWKLIKYTASTPQYHTDCSVYEDIQTLNNFDVNKGSNEPQVLQILK